LWNKAEVLNTSKGRDLRALIEAGVAIGMSIRGLGSQDNFGNILEDYEYLGTDCVGQPSAKLWAKPSTVTENFINQIQESKAMKTADEIIRHLKEQAILMKAEPKLDAFKRATVVESLLSTTNLPAVDTARVYNTWDAIKKDVLEKDITSKEPVLENTTDKVNTVATVTNAYRKSLKNIAAASTAKVEELNRKLEAAMARTRTLQKMYNESVKIAAGIKTEKETISTKYTRVVKTVEATKKEAANALIARDIAIKEAAKQHVSYVSARNMAAQYAIKYGISVQEAARVLRTAAATKPVKENTAPTRKVARTITEHKEIAEGTTRNTHRDLGTPAHNSREHMIPGFI
jgi:hypothetical protein